MKIRWNNIIVAFILFPGFLIMLLILLPSCGKGRKEGLIPEKTFAKILYEIHLADGLISNPELRNIYFRRDSVANYTDIIESHGYTKESMDKTLKYYFTEQPKKLIRIYDRAIGRLTETELLLGNELDQFPAAEGGLWKGSQSYLITGSTDTSKLYFDHVFYIAGDYTMQFILTLYPSDESTNPCFTAYTCRADSLLTGKRNYFSGIRYIRDGQAHTYNFVIKIPPDLPLIFKGQLIDFENNPEEIYRHVKIEKISFMLSRRAI